MPPLSWNEIKARAVEFSREWAGASSESAEAKSFWDAFFHVFGIKRSRIASFEEPVRRTDGSGGFIDLLWKGTLLVEHKSRGKDLDKAYRQGLDYFYGLNERDLPRFVLVSDFARFRLYDLEKEQEEERFEEFRLEELHEKVHLFGFIAGYQTRSFGQEDPVNARAAEQLGRLHDQLREAGYAGHALEVLLVRLLFCLFAEDTGIFNQRRQFQDYLEQRTGPDGADLGMHLAQFFQVLNTAPAARQRTLDEQLAGLPYVNGRLFAEMLPIPAFDRRMRETLLDCCGLDWSRISPAVFGSLFQSIMDRDARRALGAHYTSETNILRLIKPLFLDALWAEFEAVRNNRNRLFELHKRLGRLHFFDPACGCGNFLVIAYRELRLLELAILRQVARSDQMFLDIFQLVTVNVDQFHGIEIEEWPARIAEVALWLMDHQMNLLVSQEFGQYFVRLPLRTAPHIVQGNALRIDWAEVVPPEWRPLLLGNPPFVGHQWRSPEQMEDMARVWGTEGRYGRLDYVSCWYRKAADYMAGQPAIRAAFVSTNSITQGEQVGILWPDLLSRGAVIHFAHRTFQWQSEARGKAAVHCVIIGFGLEDVAVKWLFTYDTLNGEPKAIRARHINPYLVDADDVILPSRTKTPSGLPQLIKGSQPTDGGHLILTDAEMDELLREEPAAEPWLRRYLGGEELINGGGRWCLWLKGIEPEQLRRMPRVMDRVRKVAESRLNSPTKSVRDFASQPYLFTQDRQPESDFLAVPEVSSENRVYIPIGVLPSNVVASNKLQIAVGGTLFHFGVLNSIMHNAWIRAVSGRLKSDISYSPSVYNNFPWPEPSDAQRTAIESAAQGVLDARESHPGASLADLYDPLRMPRDLLQAHRALDRAVDASYGRRSFGSEAERVAFLFERYLAIAAPLAPRAKGVRKRNTH